MVKHTFDVILGRFGYGQIYEIKVQDQLDKITPV